MKRAVFLLGITAVAQTLPRPAAPFEFTLLSTKTAARLADYKGRSVVLYLFSPD